MRDYFNLTIELHLAKYLLFKLKHFEKIPYIHDMLSSCSVIRLKSELDCYLRNIVDLPCQPGFNNSLDSGDFLHGGHYVEVVG